MGDKDDTLKLTTVSQSLKDIALLIEDTIHQSQLATFSSDATDTGDMQLKPGEARVLSRISQETSTSVHDVAAFILQQCGKMTAMKLEKLVYYSQAWSLVWDEAPLFNEEIEAWANGPVVPELFARHSGMFMVSRWNGDSTKLTDVQRETILKVLEFYGDKPSQVLSDLTHRESPWLNARAGLGLTERGHRVISHSDMIEYYSSL